MQPEKDQLGYTKNKGRNQQGEPEMTSYERPEDWDERIIRSEEAEQAYIDSMLAAYEASKK